MSHIWTNHVATAVISADTTTSGVVDFEQYKLAAIDMGSAFSGTTIGFRVSPTRDGTFRTLYNDDGDAVEIVVASDRIVGIDSDAGALASVRFVKLVSDTAEPSTRTLSLIFKR